MSGRAYVLGPGEGQTVWSLGGRFTIKLTGADVGDRLSVTEALAFHSTEPSLHIHHHEDEAWYVLEGQMTFYVADEVLEAPAGAFVFGPRAFHTASRSMSNPHASSFSRRLLGSSGLRSIWAIPVGGTHLPRICRCLILRSSAPLLSAME